MMQVSRVLSFSPLGFVYSSHFIEVINAGQEHDLSVV